MPGIFWQWAAPPMAAAGAAWIGLRIYRRQSAQRPTDRVRKDERLNWSEDDEIIAAVFEIDEDARLPRTRSSEQLDIDGFTRCVFIFAAVRGLVGRAAIPIFATNVANQEIVEIPVEVCRRCAWDFDPADNGTTLLVDGVPLYSGLRLRRSDVSRIVRLIREPRSREPQP